LDISSLEKLFMMYRQVCAGGVTGHVYESVAWVDKEPVPNYQLFFVKLMTLIVP